jgi:flavin-dependent dehydrogenase
VRIETEICVVGGGPAGAVAAWKLARLGHAVLVVERAAFPRPHIGEALAPGIWTQLDLLGLTDAVCAAGFRPVATAVVRWAGRTAETVRHPDPPGLVVDRGRFDRLLLEHAREARARLLQPALAKTPRRAEGGWILPLRTPHDGTGEAEVAARFLIDAGGRSGVLAGPRRRSGPRTLALSGAWVRRGGWEEGTRVEALPDAWLWAVPRPDGTLSAMAFVDADHYRAERASGVSREALYRRLLAGSELLAETASAALAGGVEVCDATCHHAPEAVGDDFVRIGEAAFTLDPLSSTGVQKAMQTAWSAALAVHTILTRPEDADAARRFYTEAHRETVERHAAWAAGYYAEVERYAGHPFWRSRSAGAPRPPLQEAAPEIDPRIGLRLADGAAVVAAPCVTGDHIETRRALTHPALERPVAFLDGIELAPLLDGLRAGATLGEVAATWARGLAPERAAALAAWLVRRGVLVPA